jgi:DNA-binding transcriptional LysR family regulator
VIPQLTIPSARPDIAIRELDAPSLVRKISSALPRGRYTPPAARAMTEALAEAAAGLRDRLGAAGAV